MNLRAAVRISELEKQGKDIENMLRELRGARAAIVEFLAMRDAGMELSWRDFLHRREAEAAACASGGVPVPPSGRTFDPDRPFPPLAAGE